MLGYLALGTFVVGWLVFIYFRWNFGYWIKRGVKGPSPTILYGNFPSDVSRSRQLTYDHDDLYKKFKGKEDAIGVFSVRKPVIEILTPELGKQVLISCFRSFHDNPFAELFGASKDTDPLLSRNPFFLKGEEWKNKRAEITPAFTMAKIKCMFPNIQHVGGVMVKYIHEQNKKQGTLASMEGKELAGRFTLEVVSNCIYGIESSSFTDNPSQLRKYATTIFSFGLFDMIYFILVSLFPWITKIYSKSFISKEVTKFFCDLMKQAITLRNEKNIHRDDYLNYLLELNKRKPMSEIEMAANTVSFFLDGYETSSMILSMTLYELAKSPRVQSKLRDEINSFYPYDFESLQNAPYIDQVLSEVLRLHPALSVLTRIANEEFELRDSKDKLITKVEKDIIVNIPAWSFHHDSEFYPDPEEFKPERFDPEDGGVKKYRDMGVYLPFGDGPRICLGMKFAMTQMKAALADLLHNFEIVLDEKSPKEVVYDPTQFINYPKGGVWVNFKAINKNE